MGQSGICGSWCDGAAIASGCSRIQFCNSPRQLDLKGLSCSNLRERGQLSAKHHVRERGQLMLPQKRQFVPHGLENNVLSGMLTDTRSRMPWVFTIMLSNTYLARDWL
jgi:hypothetical protein